MTMRKRESWVLLGKIQANCPNTTCLPLTGIGDSQLASFTHAMKNNDYISSVFLEDCHFTDDGIASFMEVLREKRIDMFSANGMCRLTEQGFLGIIIALAQCPEIRHVSLSSENITDKVVVALACLVRKPKQLLGFAIHGGRVTGKAVEHLCRAIRDNSSLNHVFISAEEITGQDNLKPLSHAMASNPNLETVEISCKRISRRNIYHLIRGIESSEHVSWLHMGAEQAERMTVEALVKVLENNEERVGFDIERRGAVVVRTKISDALDELEGEKETAQVIELGLDR